MSDNRNLCDNCNCDFGSLSFCESRDGQSEPQDPNASRKASENWGLTWELDTEAYLLNNILNGSNADLPLPPQFDGLDPGGADKDGNPMGEMVNSTELVTHLPVDQDLPIGNSEQVGDDHPPRVLADQSYEVESPAPGFFLQQGVYHYRTTELGSSDHDMNIDHRTLCDPSIGRFRQDTAHPDNHPHVDMDMDVISNPWLGHGPDLSPFMQQIHLEPAAINDDGTPTDNLVGLLFDLPAQQAGRENSTIDQTDSQPATAAIYTQFPQDQENLNLGFHWPYHPEPSVLNLIRMPYPDAFGNVPPLQSLSEHGALRPNNNMRYGSMSQSFLDPLSSILAPAAPVAPHKALVPVFGSFQPLLSRVQQQGQDKQEEGEKPQPANQHPPRGMGKRGRRNAALHARGLCIWCRKPNPDLTKKGCLECLPLRAASTADWRKKRGGRGDDGENEMEEGEPE